MYSGRLEEGIDEKSCGAVLYQRRDGDVRYLIVKSTSGHISFSKGHVEGQETEWETACREIREETGIEKLHKTGEFRESFCCLTEEGKRKQIVYFLAQFEETEVFPVDRELTDVWLLSLGEALKRINTPEEREILKKADRLLERAEKAADRLPERAEKGGGSPERGDTYE